ncbi:hypothetical protein PcaKH15_02890 [Parageobacillus caldoxylosilyticus]|nr:hypothetical protein PcaKH15_02890 [Parageobacillus caldoxylosilyticus]BDG38154.1 hypothetical protein PcaKH16_02930 [Parageobacillus caldoxylosilyticus]BDG41941.1 hypothetical protein PcaKH35_02860 [Parageobacillus caldoxylosilyticus]
MSSLLESIEKEVKHRVYEMMIDCLQSYQGQVKEAIEEFQHGTRAFYRANEEDVPYWQGESREAYELVYRDFCGKSRHIFMQLQMNFFMKSAGKSPKFDER